MFEWVWHVVTHWIRQASCFQETYVCAISIVLRRVEIISKSKSNAFRTQMLAELVAKS